MLATEEPDGGEWRPATETLAEQAVLCGAPLGRSGRVTALPGSQLVVLSAACGVDCWVSACSWLPAWYRVRFRYALLAYAPRRVWLMACGYVGAQL